MKTRGPYGITKFCQIDGFFVKAKATELILRQAQDDELF
jgi:hypothetical protein